MATDRPFSAANFAAVRPAGPAPMIITSYPFFTIFLLRSLILGSIAWKLLAILEIYPAQSFYGTAVLCS
jgi:hypothetical protein